jgi:hypothetical protein
MCKCIKCEECQEKQKKYYNDNKDEIIRKTKEYNNMHKDEKQEYIKAYRESKKELLKEKLNKKVTCECGGRYTVRNKSTHYKSKGHKEYESKKSG